MKGKKKILMVGHDASFTGAPKSLLNLARVLTKEGYEIIFLLGRGGGYLKEYKKEGEVFLWTDNFQKNIIVRLFRKVKRIINPKHKRCIKEIKKIKPNLIFNNTVVNGEIVVALKELKIPIVSRIPELETVIQFYNKDKSSSLVLENSTMIMAVSNAVKNNLIENHNIAPHRIEVIYGFVPLINVEKYIEQKNTYRHKFGIPSTAFVVGACGSLINRKGVDFFIHVAEKLRFKKNIYWLWVGGKKTSLGYIEAKMEVKKRNLDKNVIFVGEQEKPYFFYPIMDLFFMCSREDPFPLSMLEAMQFNLPILGFKNTGGVEELLENGGGCLAEYGDVETIAAQIVEICENKIKRQKLMSELKKVRQKFNEDVSSRAFISYIKKIL